MVYQKQICMLYSMAVWIENTPFSCFIKCVYLSFEQGFLTETQFEQPRTKCVLLNRWTSTYCCTDTASPPSPSATRTPPPPTTSTLVTLTCNFTWRSYKMATIFCWPQFMGALSLVWTRENIERTLRKGWEKVERRLRESWEKVEIRLGEGWEKVERGPLLHLRLG